MRMTTAALLAVTLATGVEGALVAGPAQATPSVPPAATEAARSSTTTTASCTDGAGITFRGRMTWGGEYFSSTYGDRRVSIGLAEWTTNAGPLATDSTVKSYDSAGKLVQSLTRTATFDYKGGAVYDNRNPLDQPAPQTRAKVTVKVGRDNDGKSDCTMVFAQPTTVPAGYQQVWGDEFDGTALDTSRWDALNNTGLSYDAAYLTNRPDNVSVAGGLLHIKSVREAMGGRPWTSGYLQTKGKASWKYGRFEARLMTPTQASTSKGIWPAWWMRPDDGFQGCEIDMMEALGSSGSEEASRTHETIHRTYTPSTQEAHLTDWAAEGGPTGTPSDGFHVYALDWTPTSLVWTIDGAQVYRRDTGTTPWFTECFQRSFHFRLNQQVGPATNWSAVGAPNAATQSPSDFQVDYVRVYQAPAAP